MTPPRGGKREGAGRPAKRGERGTGVEFWLPPSLAAWAADHARSRGVSRSELVAEALEALQAGARLPAESGATANDQAALVADAQAYRTLLAGLAAAVAPTDPPGLFALPMSLTADVAGVTGAPPGRLPAALALMVARGLVATRHVGEYSTD